MPLVDGLAGVEESRWLARLNGGSGPAPPAYCSHSPLAVRRWPRGHPFLVTFFSTIGQLRGLRPKR